MMQYEPMIGVDGKTLDASQLSFEQLRVRYLSDRSESRKIGRYREYTSQEYAVTALGEIEIHKWQELAEQLIAAQHEEPLQRQMLEWVQDHFGWLRTPSKQKLESLELHVSRIFDNPLWVDFVPFNQQYRPDVLKKANLVKIKTACCDAEGITTLEQVEKAPERGGTICCPNCGRFSAFTKGDDVPERARSREDRGR